MSLVSTLNTIADVSMWVAYVGFSWLQVRKRKQMRKSYEALTRMMERSLDAMSEGIRERDFRIRQLEQEFIRHPPKPPEFNPVFQQSEVLREILEEGRRSLAKKYHPDKPTGDAEKMQQINTVVDRMVGR